MGITLALTASVEAVLFVLLMRKKEKAHGTR